MKHTYPRAIRLAEQGQVDLARIVTHRVPLAQVPEAFAMNLAYEDNVIKVVVDYG
jgi:threonine dehydrogenase-like Zn-dependent dehydrogenase